MAKMVKITETIRNCPDCYVTPGKPHEPGCDIERCSICGLQHFVCGCAGHDQLFARWTGIWPGVAEAECLGMDLNTLYSSGAYKHFFIKPRVQGLQENNYSVLLLYPEELCGEYGLDVYLAHITTPNTAWIIKRAQKMAVDEENAKLFEMKKAGRKTISMLKPEDFVPLAVIKGWHELIQSIKKKGDLTETPSDERKRKCKQPKTRKTQKDQKSKKIKNPTTPSPPR